VLKTAVPSYSPCQRGSTEDYDDKRHTTHDDLQQQSVKESRETNISIP